MKQIKPEKLITMKLFEQKDFFRAADFIMDEIINIRIKRKLTNIREETSVQRLALIGVIDKTGHLLSPIEEIRKITGYEYIVNMVNT